MQSPVCKLQLHEGRPTSKTASKSNQTLYYHFFWTIFIFLSKKAVFWSKDRTVKNFVNSGLHHRLKKAPGAYQTSQRGNRAFLWIGSPMNIDYAMHIDCDLENAGVSSPETTESSLEPFDGMLIRWFNRDPVGEGLREAICISATLSSSIPLKNTFVVHFLLQRINCKEMCNYFFLFCWNYAHAPLKNQQNSPSNGPYSTLLQK